MDRAVIIPDWILDVSISPYDPTSCALVTAHNELFLVKYVIKQNGAINHDIELKALSSPINLILYSANLIWNSSSIILIASGTVFGEIIAWKCSPGDGKNKLICKLKGHEGSVFGVDISPKVVEPGHGRIGRLIASCSDDRTIRIWDLDSSENNMDNPVAGCQLPEESTGFEPCSRNIPTSSEKGQIAAAMGHASRIWRVRFLYSEPDAGGSRLLNIISFGEDATTQQWSLRMAQHPLGNNSGKKSSLSAPSISFPAELSHCKTYAFHSGKHLWSSDLCQFRGGYCLGTGGADGRISIFEIELMGEQGYPREKVEKGERNAIYTIRVDDLFHVLQSQSPLEKIDFSTRSQDPRIGGGWKKDGLNSKDSFGRYAFVSETEVLVTTALGRVFCGSLGEFPTWKEVHLSDLTHQHMGPCAAIKSFTDHKIAYLAEVHGTISAYSCNSQAIRSIGRVEGKVADMFGLCDQYRQTHALMVTDLHKKSATILHLDNSLFGTSGATIINLPEKFITTSAGMVGKLLICGSRSGFLAVYESHRSGSPLKVFDGMNYSKEDAVTAIIPLQSTPKPSGQPQNFVVASRNGNYSIFSIALQPESNLGFTGPIQIVHQARAPPGLAIEHVWFQAQDLLFYGFKGKCFIVWNDTKQSEVMKIDCGGAHRSYAYIPFRENGGGCFVCTKASKLIFSTCKSPSHKVVKKGAHGREIKTCAVSQDCKLVATGAEDTLIKIWRQRPGKTQEDFLQPVAVIRKHTTGIQHLQWISSRYLLSSGGNEEFFIWNIHTIPYFGVGLVCEASYPAQGVETGLRITCFDATDLSNLRMVESGVLVTLGFSNSSFRSYFYSSRVRFALMAKGWYTSSCITQIRNLIVTDGSLCIITAATDGNLAVWSANITMSQETECLSVVDFQLLSAKKLHQSTVKSLDVHYSRTDQLIVATGGDDGALGISIYSVDSPTIRARGERSYRSPPYMFLLPEAHAAAVTGLSFFDHDLPVHSGGLELVTTSNDQKLKVWKVELPLETHNILDAGSSSLVIRLLKCSFTSVSDTAGLAAYGNHDNCSDEEFRVLIVGNGIEIFGIGSN